MKTNESAQINGSEPLRNCVDLSACHKRGRVSTATVTAISGAGADAASRFRQQQKLAIARQSGPDAPFLPAQIFSASSRLTLRASFTQGAVPNGETYRPRFNGGEARASIPTKCGRSNQLRLHHKKALDALHKSSQHPASKFQQLSI